MAFIAMLYGLICYAVFFVTFLYSIAFVGDIYVPKTIDLGGGAPTAEALVTNVVLLGLFAVQHSVMARPAFKEIWTRIVPRSVERSTYVLISSLLLALMFWKWQPMPTNIWDVTAPLARVLLMVLSGVGWLIVLASTFMINHFDLFGLRQVYLRMIDTPYAPLAFKQTALYRFVRHPLMLGFIIAFWATPTMSLGHLVFAIATTAYIVVGVLLEERDLVRDLGEQYRSYQKRVPMLFPVGSSKGQ